MEFIRVAKILFEIQEWLQEFDEWPSDAWKCCALSQQVPPAKIEYSEGMAFGYESKETRLRTNYWKRCVEWKPTLPWSLLGGCNRSTANVQLLSNNNNIIELD